MFPTLVVQDLDLRFGRIEALSNVSFTVDPGQLFAVIGPNGAGKSSLLNVLTRMYDATSGRVEWRGEDLLRLRPRQLSQLGVVRSFQNLGLFPGLSVLENVLVGRHHLMRSGSLSNAFALPSSRRQEQMHREAAYDALDLLDMRRHAHDAVHTLPYGLQKRVELARCMAGEPELLLLDEPVAGMNASERSEVTELIQRVHRQHDMTVVLVEHDMGMVMQVAERILVLDFGHVIAIGKPQEVQKDPNVVRAYLGEEAEVLS